MLRPKDLVLRNKKPALRITLGTGLIICFTLRNTNCLVARSVRVSYGLKSR